MFQKLTLNLRLFERVNSCMSKHVNFWPGNSHGALIVKMTLGFSDFDICWQSVIFHSPSCVNRVTASMNVLLIVELWLVNSIPGISFFDNITKR